MIYVAYKRYFSKKSIDLYGILNMYNNELS